MKQYSFKYEEIKTCIDCPFLRHYGFGNVCYCVLQDKPVVELDSKLKECGLKEMYV